MQASGVAAVSICWVPTRVGKSNSCFMEDLVLVYSVFAKFMNLLI